MINIGSKKYKICLLDTNVISNGLKNETPIFKQIIKRFPFSHYCWALTPSTVSELSNLTSYRNKLSKLLALFPNIVTKGLKELKQEEIKSYNTVKPVNFSLFSFNELRDNGKVLNPKAVEKFFINNELQKIISNLDSKEHQLLDLLLSYKFNFPPNQNGKYSKSRIFEFTEIIINRIINEDHSDFYRKNKPLNIRHFKSILISSLFTFYKFYPDKRKALLSDINDITISGIFPYVDVYIGESNMVEIVKKIRNLDSKLLSLEAIPINKL